MGRSDRSSSQRCIYKRNHWMIDLLLYSSICLFLVLVWDHLKLRLRSQDKLNKTSISLNRVSFTYHLQISHIKIYMLMVSLPVIQSIDILYTPKSEIPVLEGIRFAWKYGGKVVRSYCASHPARLGKNCVHVEYTYAYIHVYWYSPFHTPYVCVVNPLIPICRW